MHVAFSLKKIAALCESDFHFLEDSVVSFEVTGLDASLTVRRYSHTLSNIRTAGSVHTDH